MTSVCQTYRYVFGKLLEAPVIIRNATGADKGSPDKPGGLSIQLCKSEKKEFYIRYSS